MEIEELDTSDQPIAAASFRESTWSNRSLIVGLTILCIFAFAPWEMILDRLFSAIPIAFIIFPLLSEVILIAYPLRTRRQNKTNSIKLPTGKRIFKEAALAIPLTILLMIIVFLLDFAIRSLFPEISTTPDVFEQMRRSGGSLDIYVFLATAFLTTPFAEEFFFRGFMFNAFRRRMPIFIAIISQSIIFGAMHYPSQGFGNTIIISFMGIFFTVVYMWRKTILAPICIHAGFNFAFAVGMLISMQTFPDAAVLGIRAVRKPNECIIDQVSQESPAEKAGIQPGDKIIQFEDWSIRNFQDLLHSLEWHQAGDSVRILVTRDAKQFEFEVVFSSRRMMHEEYLKRQAEEKVE